MTETELRGLLQQADGILVAITSNPNNPPDPSVLEEAAAWRTKYAANVSPAEIE